MSRWITLVAAVVTASLAPWVSGAQLRLSQIFPRPPAECGEERQLDEETAAFVRAHSIGISTSRPGTTYVRIVTAGDHLVLRSVSQTSLTIRVRIAVKLSGDSTFEEVCATDAWTPGFDSPLFSARLPRQDNGSVWRIELTVEGAAHAVGGQVSIEVLRAPNSTVDVDRPPLSEVWNDAFGLLCIDDIPAARFQKRSAHGFSGIVRLDVDTVSPGIRMNSAQEDRLRELVLRAVSIWVQGCAACRTEQLVVVLIDGRFFIRASVVDWYDREYQAMSRGASSQTLETDLRNTLEPVQVLQATGPGESLPRSKMLTPYVEIESPSERFSALCERSPKPVTPVLSTVRNAVCFRDELPQRDRASIRIRFREGATYCGDDVDIIACRADRELTEYNVRDFRFDTGDDAAPIGDGDIEVDLLMAIVHEMGHWIGLGHINKGESVMADSADVARCIDFNTISTLVRTRTGSPVTTPLAFRLHQNRKR